MEVTEFGIEILSSPHQSALEVPKHLSPIVFSLDGSLIVFRDVHPAKAPSPKAVIPLWMVTFFSEVQLLNIPFGISFIFLGIVNSSRDVDQAKRLAPKVFTEDGMLTDFRFGRFAKDAYPSSVMVSGTSIVTIELRFV